MSAACREILFQNARLVLSDQIVGGSLAVRDGLIADLDGAAGSGAPVIDCAGDFLAPGLIEIHTDNFEKHLMPRANVLWPAFPALLSHDAQVAGAGITTVYDAVAVGTHTGKEERLQYLRSAIAAIRQGVESGHLRADHFLHLRCEVPHPNTVDLFNEVIGEPLVRLISLMDHTPGDRQFMDIAGYRESCITHYGETPEEFDARIALEQKNQARFALTNRQAIAQSAAERGLTLASHDDARPVHIEEARALGATISEFPTTVEAARLARDAGLATIMGAPNVIRGGSHSGNVAARDLAERDLLDALSSDYMPISLVSAPFQIAQDLGWPLWRAMALVTANPARMLGLADRGRLETGLRADLVRIRETPLGPVVRGVWRQGERVA